MFSNERVRLEVLEVFAKQTEFGAEEVVVFDIQNE
jgi:hypothetical protein